MNTRFLLAAAVVLAECRSQIPTHISPAAAATGLGTVGGFLFDGFLRGSSSVTQQVHDASSFNNGNATLVQTLSFRMANRSANTPGRLVDVEIFMAQSPNDSLHASPVFASNVVPGTEVNVFFRKQLTLPQVPDNSWAVAPFAFDRPFAYLPVGAVSWRIVVWRQSGGTSPAYGLDAWLNSGPSTPTGTYAGCSFTQQSVRVAPPGGDTIFSALESVSMHFRFILVALGLSATSLGGVPLPLDLGPHGAPGCLLTNDWVALIPVSPIPPVYAALLRMPPDRSLTGAVFHSQFLLFGGGHNALGLMTSPGRTNQIPAPLGITQIGDRTSATAVSGGVQPQYGVAIGLN